MEADAAEQAALEKAPAEQVDPASVDEMLCAYATLHREHGGTVRLPRTQK